MPRYCDYVTNAFPVRCEIDTLTKQPDCGHSFFLETIADAVERLDHIELAVACLELSPQPLDMTVDSSVST